jgi:hypothetical protein
VGDGAKQEMEMCAASRWTLEDLRDPNFPIVLQLGRAASTERSKDVNNISVEVGKVQPVDLRKNLAHETFEALFSSKLRRQLK